MCYFTRITKIANQLENQFNAQFEPNIHFEPALIWNGFDQPQLPIICNKAPNTITLGKWGLLPSWAYKTQYNANTLNAQIESVNEKPSFQPYVNQRCWVLVDGFYEWKWLDVKGKKKEQYLLSLANDEAFALAGLYNEIIEPSRQTVARSFTILTTVANELMANIHNTKKRMPIVLEKNSASDWLNGAPLENFKYNNPPLIATSLSAPNPQQLLF